FAMSADQNKPLPVTSGDPSSPSSSDGCLSTQGHIASDETAVQPPQGLGSFGRYHLERLIGQGGMGEVYLAPDPPPGRTGALKVPRPANGTPLRRERFLREARAAAGLMHPAICRVFDVGEVEGRPYLTMAFVQGKSLAQALREGGPLPGADAARL